jgi:hypothetical protein
MPGIDMKQQITLWYVLLQCMLRQQQHLILDSGEPHLFGKNTSNAAWAHVRFLGEEVQCKCREYNAAAPIDKHPHYIIRSPGVMAVKRGYCGPCLKHAKKTIGNHIRNHHNPLVPTDGRPHMIYTITKAEGFTGIKIGANYANLL